MCGGGSPVDDFFDSVTDPVKDVGKDIIDVGKDVLSTIEDTAKAIIKNPLPVIQTIALTAALGPGGLALATTTSGAAAIAGAAVSAMNGGNVKDIAIAAGTSYLGSEIGQAAGKSVAANTAVKSMDAVTQATIKQVVTSASGSAAVTALKGGSLEDVLKAGVTAGVGSYVNSTLVREYGFDPKALDTQVVTNATAAATRAVLNGKSITDAVVNTTAVSALALTISGSVDKLTSSDAAYQKVYKDFTSLKDSAVKYFENIVSPAEIKAEKAYEDAQKYAKEFNSLDSAYGVKYDKYLGLKSDVETYNKTFYAPGQAEDGLPPYKFVTSKNDPLALKYGIATEPLRTKYPNPLPAQYVYQGVTYYRIDPPPVKGIVDSANKVVEELNQLAADSKITAGKLETAYKTFEGFNTTLGEYQATYKTDYLDKLTALEKQATDISKTQETLSKQIGQDIVKYEQEVAKVESELGEKIREKAVDLAADEIINNQIASKNFGPDGKAYYDALREDGVSGAEAIKEVKNTIDVARYEEAVARGEDSWVDSEGKQNILITGVGTSDTVSAPKVDDAVTRIAGLFGFGTPDPDAAFSALFGGATGTLSIPGLWATGTEQQKQEAIQYVDDIIKAPDSTEAEKTEAEKLKEKIKLEEQMSLKKTADRKASENQKALTALNAEKTAEKSDVASAQRAQAENNLNKANQALADAKASKNLDAINKATIAQKNAQVAFDAAVKIASDASQAKRSALVQQEFAEKEYLKVINSDPVSKKAYEDQQAALKAKAEADAKAKALADAKAAADAKAVADAAAKAEADRQNQIRLAAEAEAKRVADAKAAATAKAAADAKAIADAKAAADQAAWQKIYDEGVAKEKALIEAKKLEEARLQAEANARVAAEAEAARLAAIKAEQDRLAAIKAQEDARLAAEAKAVEDARLAAIAKAQEEARLAAEAQAAEDARLAAEEKARQDAEAAANAGTGTTGGTTGGTGGTGTGTTGGTTGGTGTGGTGTTGGTTTGGTGTTGGTTGGTGTGTGTGGTTGTGSGQTGGGTGSTTGGTGTGGGGTGGTGTGGGTGLPRPPKTPAYLAYAALLSKLGGNQGAGYQFALPDLLASREAVEKSPTGEFVTPVEYTYRNTGETYIPGQFTPPVPTTQAAEGGLMLENLDPTNAVQMYASGGITGQQDMYKMLISKGYTPQQAQAYIAQQSQVGRSRRTPVAKETDEQGLMSLAKGGNLPPRYLNGATDGMADKIPAKIGAKQPAALSHGEFVIPADVVSHLGNGNSEAGAQVLYNMMDRIRKARTGTTKQGKEINPNKFMPKG